MPPAKKILIVDDEAMIRKAVHLALEKEGYEVVEAETGGEALRRIELSKPDLILLDIMLPDVSGFDVCRDIRKAGLRVPIIILSAKTEEIDVVVGLEIGADDYITKPFRTRELLARIAAHLRKARQEEEAVNQGRLEFKDLVIDLNERGPLMATFGYTLMCDQIGPKELVRNGIQAERAGFDFTVISDHFHPWLEEQGESPFAWSVLGAVASQTSQMQLMTMVTCPTVRYHPAIVAQMAATIGLMSDDRFTLGLGAGENLNEHVVGEGWPPANIRHLMVEEAIHVIRELWKGGYVSHQGDFYEVHDARI